MREPADIFRDASSLLSAYLPPYLDDALLPEEEKAIANAAAAASETILVIDDEATIGHQRRLRLD